MLVFGPAVSMLAALLLVAAPVSGVPLLAAVAAHGLLGFGPMLWLIGRNTLLQIRTPPALLGRVNAVMQITVFGMRPLGALAGAAVGAALGLDAAVLLACLGFAVSLCVVLAWALRRRRAAFAQ
jgi:hypothetical protein